MKAEETKDGEVEKIEIELLLEGVYRRYGYDFRRYSYPSVRRRVIHRMQLEGFSSACSLLGELLRDPDLFGRLLGDLVIPVTEMFRDPPAFLAFRRGIVPELRKLPFVRIWHAGCSTGEEPYSAAILLQEEGLLNRTRIYGTDISEGALEQAKDGLMPIGRMRQYTQNYQAAGGLRAFSEYYATGPGSALIKPHLRNSIVFARHNLATDQSFNEFDVIFCRNVMIYFDTPLREQVHRLIYDSLTVGGFLVLGNKESISFTQMADRFETWDEENRIFRKIK